VQRVVRDIATSDDPIPIQQQLSEATFESPALEAGNTPVWQQPLDLPDVVEERSETGSAARPVVEREPLPLDRPEVELPEPVRELPAMELPDFPTQAVADETTPVPEAVEPEVAAATGTPAAIDSVERPAAEARPEAGAIANTRVRQPMAREQPTEAMTEIEPTEAPLGTAQRMAPDPEELALSTPLPLDQNPDLPRAQGETSDTIVRKAGPATMPLDQPAAGVPAPATTGSKPSTFTRGARRGTTGPSESMEVARAETFRPNRDAGGERLQAGQRPSFTDADAAPTPELIRRKPQGALIGTRPNTAASTYKLRRRDGRRDTALRNGGTAETEAAVEDALAYLARMQEPEGFWDADRHGGGVREVRQIDAGKPAGGKETDTGLTGLAILAYLGAGYTHEEGQYAEPIRKAIDWLIAQQREDGYLGGGATYYDQMYCHGIATYALAEAYGMQTDPAKFPTLRDAVTRGVWYIIETQNEDGGWRYRKGASLSDMSMFGWQLMALKSAELAGIATPTNTRGGMIQFLKDRSRGNSGGLAGYKQESQPSPAMTAEALFCKQMYGLRRSSPAGVEGVRYLQANLPDVSRPDEYYWYYGTLAMFQYGGEPWNAWNGKMRDTLVRLQRRGGELQGSWDPIGPWGSVGGRIYSTALSTMCLEVYYRFLPLYQVTGAE
jgi:hypothetical protein